MKVPGLDRLNAVGYVGERKALAQLSLAFFAVLFFLITLSARTELPEWLPLFGAMTALYVTAFFAVAAEWFWGRWFATGLGYWGLTMAIMSFVTTRSLPPAMVVFGILHGLVSVCLMGEKMAARFDAKPDWRERWKLDEQGVIRVRRSVTRAASSLPALILFALAPREGQSLFGNAVTDVTAVVLGGAALFSLVSLLAWRRTWSVFGLAATGVGLLVHSIGGESHLYSSHSYVDPATLMHAGCALSLSGLFAGGLLIAAAMPFLGPVAAYLVRGRK